MSESRQIIVNRKTGKMCVVHPDDLEPGRNIERSIKDGSVLLVPMPDRLLAKEVRQGHVKVDVNTREVSEKHPDLWPENFDLEKNAEEI